MKIETKKIKFVPGHDDCHSFTAVVYVDGKAALHASNDGWGGPNMYHPVDGYTGPNDVEIDKWLAANTPKVLTGYEEPGEDGLDNCLDFIVGDALNDEARKKEAAKFKRKLKKGVSIKEGDVYTWKFDPTPVNLERAGKQFPEHQFVNGNTKLEAKAEALWLGEPVPA